MVRSTKIFYCEWLLTRDAGLAAFLGTRNNQLPSAPGALPDPKAESLRIAHASPRREKREALVRVDKDGNRHQGPAYNSTLAEFVSQDWVVSAAANGCASLGRVFKALERLETNWKLR